MSTSAYVTFAVTHDRDRSSWFWVVLAGLPAGGVPRGAPLAHGWAPTRAAAAQAARALDPTGLFSIEQPPLGPAILKRKAYAADGKSRADRAAEAKALRARAEDEAAQQRAARAARDAGEQQARAARGRAAAEGWSRKTAAELDAIVRAEARDAPGSSAARELAQELWRGAFAREWEEAARRIWKRQAAAPRCPGPRRPPADRTPPDALRALGLAPGASAADIKRSYRQLARQHHPDHGGDPATFIASTRAYERALGAVAS